MGVWAWIKTGYRRNSYERDDCAPAVWKRTTTRWTRAHPPPPTAPNACTDPDISRAYQSLLRSPEVWFRAQSYGGIDALCSEHTLPPNRRHAPYKVAPHQSPSSLPPPTHRFSPILFFVPSLPPTNPPRPPQQHNAHHPILPSDARAFPLPLHFARRWRNLGQSSPIARRTHSSSWPLRGRPSLPKSLYPLANQLR